MKFPSLTSLFGVGRGTATALHNPSAFSLKSPAERRRLQRVIIDIARQTDALIAHDIGDWRNAWQMAINVDSPNRQRLYDIYADVAIDLHLSGCIAQREGFVLSRSFKLVNDQGKEDEEALKLFDAVWFKQLLKYILSSIWWGHSLIELGPCIKTADGRMAYDGVRLIPRKHVIPEYHRAVTDLGQDWHDGIDYHEEPVAQWLIEAGQPDALGLYLKAATQTIPKKHALRFWDTFAEIFGMPMRIAKSASRDKKELDRIETMLREAGAAQYILAPDGTDIDVVESTRGDAFNVYDKRIDRANSEISKLVLGQTMTIEDGSSLSQSETHLKVFQNLVEADRDFIRDIINGQLLPRMVSHNFPVQGLSFEWDDSVDYSPEQQRQYEELILNNFEVEPSYFAEKYNMPVGQRRQTQPAPTLSAPTQPAPTPSGPLCTAPTSDPLCTAPTSGPLCCNTVAAPSIKPGTSAAPTQPTGAPSPSPFFD